MTNNIDKQSMGDAGCVIVNGTTQTVPEGQYFAVSFVVDSTIATGFTAAETPLMTGTQTGITYPAGFTIFTPFAIGSSSTGRVTGTAIFYKAL
jgi:hypothetical protein